MNRAVKSSVNEYLTLCADETDRKLPKNETLEEHRKHCEAKKGNCPFEINADRTDDLEDSAGYCAAPEKAQYMMVRLSEKARETLLNMMKMVGPSFENIYADHMTLAYGEKMNGKKFPEIGTKETLTCTDVVWDDKAMAIVLDKTQPTKMNCQNANPHVTLSTAEGIRPSYSNELVRKFRDGDKSVQSLRIDGLKLEGVVDAELKRNVNEKQKSLQHAPFHVIIERAKKIAEEIENGNGIHQRIPEKALSGLRRGGRLLEEATSIARIWETPSDVAPRPGQREESAQRQRKSGFIQEQKLEEYAKHKGVWEDDIDVRLGQRFGDGTNGSESFVYFDDANRTVHKLITDAFYREVIHNLDRIALHNYVFPDTAMKVVGFGKTKEDWTGAENPMFVIHVTQPFVEISDTASGFPLKDHMRNLGFKESRQGTWESEDGSVKIDDLHEENAVLDKNGNVRVIDAVLAVNTPEAEFGGTYKVNPIES